MGWEAPGYTEVRQLGTGAAGRVVLAVHDDTGIHVAVKYLSDRWRRDPVALARFRAEARTLTTLRHPNIATLWEYIQDPQGAAIVMELVNGVSLRALLREHGATGPEAALVVLKGSLLGLARAHETGLVHRDYKPENVIVRDDGVSKLVDFGIAVREGTLSRPEGTPPYMAPELWAGEPSSAATDVYAATAVFFECLTGQRPYRSTEPVVLGYQHVHAPIPVQDAPEPVRGLVERGLAKDPAARPAGAEAFVAELEAVAAAAYGDDWEERGRRRLAALVLLLAVLMPEPPPAEPQVSTTLARTTFRGVRGHVTKTAMGATLAALVAVSAALVIANRDRATPFEPVAAAPPTESGVPVALPPTPSTTPQLVPEDTADPEDTGAPEDTGDPPGGTDSDPPPTATPPFTATAGPSATRTTGPSATRTSRPTPTRTATPTATATRTATPTPTRTPTRTVTPTPSPVTSVSRLGVGRLAVDGATAAGTFTLAATGAAPVTVEATWRAGGRIVHVERLGLRGDTAYTRTLRHTFPERPCGQDVTLTVASTPAAPGGARSATVSVPPCPTEVTALRATLRMDGATARARLLMTTSGTAEVPVSAAFAVDGDQVADRSATLSGRTSYTRDLTYAFRARPCGSTVSVLVRAGGRTASARARVTCPPEVKSVSIIRSAYGDGTATATVAVGTGNARPVRLTVTFQLGGRVAGSQVLELAGDTSYVRTVRQAFGQVPCGTAWQVRASTEPGAGSGTAVDGGRTPACEPEEPTEEPTEQPTEEPTEGPGTIG
ncbi:serine/threonine-protein kinase [Nonomuraea sp. NPDC023979]|uniref:serine/threonine-protein kinase n=1 Tax=Nonomuraea sp. NPDC023979 TaxID=3154796 RepID=UPI0033FCEF8B